jgi:hypothetical protein
MRLTTMYAALYLLITLSGCESDKSRMEKSTQIVTSFISNLSLDNYELMYKSYPAFKEVKTYWKPQDFKIKSTSVSEDETVTVLGKFAERDAMFQLKKVNGKYVIVHSKGLSSDFNSSLYKYCKNIGCIRPDSYDAEVSKICAEKKDDFESLVYRIKNSIESNFELVNHTLRDDYGYVSGDITVKNNSRFTIPSRSYNIYYHFTDGDGNIVFTSKEVFNYEIIPYRQGLTRHLMERSSGNFQRIKVQLKLISTDFIENIIAENATGANCSMNNDL